MTDQTRVLPKSLAFTMIGFLVFFAAVDIILLLSGGTPPPHSTPSTFAFVFISAFLINPLLVLLGTRFSLFKLLAILWFNLTTGLMVLWFSEIVSPFTALWSMIILLTSMYYGWRGFAGSAGFLIVIATLYCVLYADDLSTSITEYIGMASMVVCMTVVTSYFFMRIIADGRRKNQELLEARKSEQMQVNRQNTLLNSISDAVLTLNRYGRITSQNAAAQAFFDTNKSLIGRDLETLLPLTDADDEQVKFHEFVYTVKTTLLRDDLSTTTGGSEEKRHISLQMSRIRSTFDDDEEYGVVVIIRDITKQKSLEEEKDEFISVASHELRTPVAIAEGSLSNLLVMYEKDADVSVLHEAAQTAYTQVIYLSKIINDLSTLSRAERGVGDVVEEIDVKELLHDLYTRYETEASEKTLHLNLDIDTNLPHIETSRLYLEEILQNFVTNAIKYTKEGSVTIAARLLPSGHIECAVTDTGIGISKADLEHIFEKFYRSEDYRTRETSGTGLGLYVVRKLADKLETEVKVESRLDHGSTFSFVLPLKSKHLTTNNALVTQRKPTENTAMEGRPPVALEKEEPTVE